MHSMYVELESLNPLNPHLTCTEMALEKPNLTLACLKGNTNDQGKFEIPPYTLSPTHSINQKSK